MRLQAAIEGRLMEHMAAETKTCEAAATGAMRRAADGLKAEIREQITGAGLGRRLANAVRSRTYPQGRQALDPTGLVWSNAPKLTEVFETGATIRPVNGTRYLAIPTENVPNAKGGKRRKMSPVEVEAAFNQDLKFAKAGNGRLVAYVDAVGARNGRGFRRATEKRLASGRNAVSVVMFIMVPQVRLRKRLDIQAAGERWAARLPGMIASELGDA